MREGYCKTRVYGRGRSFGGSQCLRKATKDDYCSTHHPDAVRRRDRMVRNRIETNRRFEEYLRMRKQIAAGLYYFGDALLWIELTKPKADSR